MAVSALNECVGPCISVQILHFLLIIYFFCKKSSDVDDDSLYGQSLLYIVGICENTSTIFTQAVKETSISLKLLLLKIKRLIIKKVFCVFYFFLLMVLAKVSLVLKVSRREDK